MRLALALGGEAAARLSQALHHCVSATTLLRRIRQMPGPGRRHPSAVGVDGWALRKGHRYGTILVDLDAHRPIDLLPDRTSDGLIAWLKDQPQIGVLSRDRSTEYARAATEGAPQAIQVADRFHLLASLRQSLERLVARHRSDLCGIAIPSVLSRGNDTPAPVIHQPARRSPEEEALRHQSERARNARLDAIHALKEDGANIR